MIRNDVTPVGVILLLCLIGALGGALVASGQMLPGLVIVGAAMMVHLAISYRARKKGR